MNNLAAAVLAQLEKVVLSYSDAEGFSLINNSQPWFEEIWGTQFPQDLIGSSDYLDNFLIDATEFWQQGNGRSISSGPFIESVSSNSKLPLEAEAHIVEGQAVLILTNLGESYQQRLDLLQAARQNLLTQEQLEIEVSKRTATIREREFEISGRLIYASGFRDEETGAHIRRIGMYSAAMAKALGWSQYAVDDILSAAPMHDLGKIGIPDTILKKPGRSTEEEFSVMQSHPLIGGQILGGSESDMIKMASDIAECHHECWDGSGYPKGLKGDEIPIAARIVSIVDVYDALVHARVYKPAFSEPEALAIMAEQVGKKYDPELFQVFLDNLQAMRDIRAQVLD